MNGDVLSEFIDFIIENCESPLNKSESIDFLTDFIYSIHNDFDISLRDVAKWLKINVNALKKTVHRSYKNKKDYIIDRQYTSGRPSGAFPKFSDLWCFLISRNNTKLPKLYILIFWKRCNENGQG